MKTACDGMTGESKSPQHIQYCAPPWLNTACTLLFYKNKKHHCWPKNYQDGKPQPCPAEVAVPTGNSTLDLPKTALQ